MCVAHSRVYRKPPPHSQGSRYFYYFNSGLQQQFVLYTQPALDAEPSVLLDPNTLSDDGTVALRDASFSEDGALLAYQVWRGLGFGVWGFGGWGFGRWSAKARAPLRA